MVFIDYDQLQIVLLFEFQKVIFWPENAGKTYNLKAIFLGLFFMKIKIKKSCPVEDYTATK